MNLPYFLIRFRTKFSSRKYPIEYPIAEPAKSPKIAMNIIKGSERLPWLDKNPAKGRVTSDGKGIAVALKSIKRNTPK